MKKMSPRNKIENNLYISLLGFFIEKPWYGYELYKYIIHETSFSRIWFLKQSQFYGFLDRLSEDGFLSQQLIEGNQYPDRKLLTITAGGKEQLADWLASPVKRGRDMRQEFLVKLFIGKEYLPQKVHNLIKNQKSMCQKWIKDQTKLLENEKDQFQILLIKYRSMQIQTMLDWLDMINIK